MSNKNLIGCLAWMFLLAVSVGVGGLFGWPIGTLTFAGLCLIVIAIGAAYA